MPAGAPAIPYRSPVAPAGSLRPSEVRRSDRPNFAASGRLRRCGSSPRSVALLRSGPPVPRAFSDLRRTARSSGACRTSGSSPASGFRNLMPDLSTCPTCREVTACGGTFPDTATCLHGFGTPIGSGSSDDRRAAARRHAPIRHHGLFTLGCRNLFPKIRRGPYARLSERSVPRSAPSVHNRFQRMPERTSAESTTSLPS